MECGPRIFRVTSQTSLFAGDMVRATVKNRREFARCDQPCKPTLVTRRCALFAHERRSLEELNTLTSTILNACLAMMRTNASIMVASAVFKSTLFPLRGGGGGAGAVGVKD